MLCNSSWQLLRNPKLVWHPARLIKEGECVDLPMDTLHLKYPFAICGSEGSALTLPLFLRSPSIISIFHCYSTMTKDHFLVISYGSKLPLCVNVGLNTHSFIHSLNVTIRAKINVLSKMRELQFRHGQFGHYVDITVYILILVLHF